MRKWMLKLYPLACGGVTLGVLQAFESIDFNQIWFQFWVMILNAFITLLVGGDPSALFNAGTGSQSGSFFL